MGIVGPKSELDGTSGSEHEIYRIADARGIADFIYGRHIVEICIENT